ncbi:MAG: ABC transporter permease [Defluviitaleaceae bacterium]|nr:ABC transporter permease [Defluviitaleaceae bacterium]
MKNNIMTIFKKEASRIIHDQKLFFSAVIMPGLLIFVMYMLMGNFMGNMMASDEDHVYQVHAVNMPTSVSMMLSIPELNMEITDVPATDAEEARQQVADRDIDLLIVFPSDFDAALAADNVPNIEVWSNAARISSMEARNMVTAILDMYHQELAGAVFTINAPSADAPYGHYDLATDADIFGMVLGFMIPMMFLIFIYTGCLAIAPETISGQKERGTLGALLVTPAKRSHMAIGKILAISVFAMLGAVGSMIGMAFGMPSLMGIELGALLEFYSLMDAALLLLVAVSTTLVFVGLLSILSAYAKSVKEATAYATPIMLIATLCGLASTILGRVPAESVFYLIPIFNSALSISSIVGFEVNALNMALTAGVNLVATMICALVVAKMFSSEKIVFS